MSEEEVRRVAVRVPRGARVVASAASLAALVCAPQRREEARDPGDIVEEVERQLAALRARRGRATRR